MRVAAIQGRHDDAPHDEISDAADPILSLEDEALVDAFVHRFASFRPDLKQRVLKMLHLRAHGLVEESRTPGGGIDDGVCDRGDNNQADVNALISNDINIPTSRAERDQSSSHQRTIMISIEKDRDSSFVAAESEEYEFDPVLWRSLSLTQFYINNPVKTQALFVMLVISTYIGLALPRSLTPTPAAWAIYFLVQAFISTLEMTIYLSVMDSDYLPHCSFQLSFG